MHRALALLFAIPVVMAAQPLTQSERDRAMSYLHATRKQFLDIVATAPAEQLRYKPPANRWSMAEIAEHLILVEDSVYQAAQAALQRPEAEPNLSMDEKVQNSRT